MERATMVPVQGVCCVLLRWRGLTLCACVGYNPAEGGISGESEGRRGAAGLRERVCGGS